MLIILIIGALIVTAALARLDECTRRIPDKENLAVIGERALSHSPSSGWLSAMQLKFMQGLIDSKRCGDARTRR
jgi:hypothetical protein